MPRIRNLFKPIEPNKDIKTTLDKSDFEFNTSNILNENIPVDVDLINFEEPTDNQVSKDEYRTAYPLEHSSIKTSSIQADYDFFKSLEGIFLFNLGLHKS